MLFALFLLTLVSCKKEVTEVSVDAFAQLNNEVVFVDGVYNVQFTLQQYPYKEVGVKLATNKTMFNKNTGLTQQTANEISSNRYSTFYNLLTPKTIYYYQIYVKDSASSKEVYSDVFSFTTNP